MLPHFQSRIKIFFIIIVIAFSLASCSVSKYFKNYVYVSDTLKSSHFNVQPYKVPTLRVGDRIAITVTALNPLAAQAFNQISASASGQSSGGGSGATGYLINSTGNIQFPQLGDIKVEGLTTDSVGKVIENKLLDFLKQPTVSVSQTNYNINVLGEVSKPGIVNVPDGKMTILEAISRSGDLTLMGKRENVLVIRENNGKREFGRVDLSSNNLFNSPFYYMQQGDFVYVDVNPLKLKQADNTITNRLSIVSIFVSMITALFVIKNSLK